MPSEANQCTLPIMGEGRGEGLLYIKPTFEVIDIDTSQVICQSIQNNAGIGSGGGSSNSGGSGDNVVVGRAARSRDWAEWEGEY